MENRFGFSFFVTIFMIIASITNNANSAAIQKVWPKDIHLDGSNWNNSCNLSFINVHGQKMVLADSLEKIELTIALESMFNSERTTVLNIHKDTSNLTHQYKAMPKFNKTLPVKKLLRDIHKSVQQFVGLFDALSKQFSNIDSLKQNSTKEISTELRYFLNESKLLLCEIETSLNVSHQAMGPQYLTENEMKQKILKMTRHLNKTSKVIELDAFYAKKSYYEFLVELSKYLKIEIRKQRQNRTKSGNKKSLSKERKIKRKNGKNNNSIGSESSAMKNPRLHHNKPKRINNKSNNSNNSNNRSSRKNQSQEGGKQLIRRRQANKSTPSPAAA